MDWLLDSKTHELMGNACKKNVTKDWSELSNKNGIKIMRRECKKESVVLMRSDMTVKCSPETA